MKKKTAAVTKGSRRLGLENAQSRALLVEAADNILIEEGAHAISARRVADRAGLKPQLVHYYFKTMDDLLIAVFRRAQEDYLKRHGEGLEGREPLDAIWKLNNEPKGTRRMMEFIALAGRRDAVRSVILESAAHFRKLQIAAIDRVLKERGVDRTAFPPAGVAMLMATVSRGLVMEETLGLSLGHPQLRAIVKRLLKSMENSEQASAPKKRIRQEI
jgi:AcrR family transcriptional regulator